LQTNVLGTQELTNRVLAVMRRQGRGRVIYNSSVLGVVSFKHRGAYVASKYAIEGLADTLRLELKGSGIEAILIEPGPITSDFRKNALHAFLQNIDREGSVFREEYEATLKRLQRAPDAKAAFELPPERVVEKLIRALESRRPKARYTVTFPTALFSFLKRLLPVRWLDWIILKAE
jgi:short-subunit dehydrogenase